MENLADGSVYLDLRGSSSRGTGGDSAASNIAADIAVDASGFSGNLSSTDTDQQTLNETVDGLDLSYVEEVTSDPSSPATGKVWMNTSDDKLKIKVAAGTYAIEMATYTAD